MILGGTIEGFLSPLSSEGREVKVVRTSEDLTLSDESIIVVDGKVTLTIPDRAVGRKYEIVAEQGTSLRIDAVSASIKGGYIGRSGVKYQDESFIKVSGPCNLELLYDGREWHLSGIVF